MAVWVLTGFMGCGKSSIGRAAAKMLGVGGMPTQEFASLTPPSLRDGPPASVPRVARPSEAHHHASAAFIDLDEEIVRRCGRSIPEIFAAEGEQAFRAIERDTLAKLLPEANSPRGNDPQPQLLIALGGGTLMSEDCRELVKKNARCIYLRAKVETLAENLRADDVAGRPMLAGVNPEAPAESPDSLESRIASMMTLRGPIYEKAADIILDIDGLSYEDVAQRVLNL